MPKNTKDYKLTSTFSNEPQLLQLTEEDIVLNLKLLEKMDISDQEFNESLATPAKFIRALILKKICKQLLLQSVGILAQRRPYDQVAECFSCNYYQNINQTINSQCEEDQRSYYNFKDFVTDLFFIIIGCYTGESSTPENLR